MARITNITLTNGNSYDIYPSEIDNTPVDNSDKVITSGGVYDAVEDVASDLESLNTTVLGDQPTSITSRLTSCEEVAGYTTVVDYDSADEDINFTHYSRQQIRDIDPVITEVREARGTFNSLDARMDDMDSNISDKLDPDEVVAGANITVTASQGRVTIAGAYTSVTESDINTACPDLADY